MTRPSIFITGAARGIGRACAERFAAAGYLVGLHDIDAEALAATAALLGDRHGHDHVHHQVLDVRSSASVEAAIAKFGEQTRGRLDVLLNNAGVMHVGGFEQVTIAQHRQTVAVNLMGVIEVAHAGFELLANTTGARLINLSSAAAIYGVPEMASYSATKHAVRGLSEALDIEWERFGIRVADVMPAFVDTELLTKTQALRAAQTLGVRLQARDVADVVWAAATSRRHRVHWPVGGQTWLSYHAAGLAPAMLQRWVIRRLSRQPSRQP